ncbi:MAG: stage II sporulation protein P, partial [Clostridia bacterium]|nr:stage II sporulation protein P [Clostridia bacterium]
MRKKQKKQSRLIKPAAMLGAFLCLLLGFTVIKAWPEKKQTDKQAWTASLLSVGLPVSTKPSLKPKAEDDDWPMPEQTQAPASTPKEDAAAAARPVKNMLSDARPAVMLYSTHSNESYRKTEETVYTEQPNSRTMNNEYNILKINHYLSSLLAEQHELPILFDA